MATADGRLLIRTEVDTRGVRSGLGGVRTSLLGVASGARAATTATGAFAAALATTGVGAILLAVGALFSLGKASVSVGSDLQEVQNVVDVSFGSMKYKIEDFSETSVKNFGLSELSAKRMASVFAAMSTGIGQDLEDATDYAVEMTGRLGDIASFYNKSVSEIETIGRAVYSGETEPLKQIGIIMTQNNLDLFAMQQGYKTLYTEMSASQQLLVRQEFFLEKTAQAQGDFVRTQDSWANQTRILKEQLGELLGMLGQGLIQVLIPVVKGLNEVLSLIITIAKGIAAIGAAFTGTSGSISGTTGAVEALNAELDLNEDSASGAAAAQDKLASGIGSAGKAAEKSLAAFDKIDKLQSNMSGSSGGGIGGLNGLADFSIPNIDLSGIESELEKEPIDLPVVPFLEPPNPPLNLSPVTVDVIPFIFPLPSPVYDPNWGLDIPPIELPDFPAFPDPVFDPNWNIVSTLEPEMVRVEELWDLAWKFMTKTIQTESGTIKEEVIALKESLVTNTGIVYESCTSDFYNLAVNSEAAIRTFAANTGGYIYEWANNVMGNVKTACENMYTNASNFVNATAVDFASWGNSVMDSVYKTAVKMRDSFVSSLRSMWDSFVSWAKSTGSAIADFFSENKDTIIKGTIITAAVIAAAGAVYFSGGAALPYVAPALTALPALATGTVVPPNKEFMALLGDNKKEVEIVSPLSTMKQAFREVASEGIGGSRYTTVVLEVNGREFGRAVVELGQEERQRISPRLVVT